MLMIYCFTAIYFFFVLKREKKKLYHRRSRFSFYKKNVTFTKGCFPITSVIDVKGVSKINPLGKM